LFSLFGTVFATCKHLEADWFRYFALYSLFGSIWKLTGFATLDCFDTGKTNQRKQSSFQMLPKQCTGQNSEKSFLVSLTLSHYPTP